MAEHKVHEELKKVTGKEWEDALKKFTDALQSALSGPDNGEGLMADLTDRYPVFRAILAYLRAANKEKPNHGNHVCEICQLEGMRIAIGALTRL